MKKSFWFLLITLLVCVLGFSACDSGVVDDPYLPSTSNMPETSYVPTVTTVPTPFGADECVGQMFSAVRSEFNAVGFMNIKLEVIEDLKLIDANKVDTIESVSVGGKTDFIKGQEFEKTDEVIIRYHTYKKCDVTIHVDFVPNLLFNKYDVNLLLNGISKGTMAHGTDKDFKFTVNPGEYTITFESDESSSVTGEIELTIDCDIDASYKISCHGSEVAVETIYVDRLEKLAEGEVKVDVPASEYKYKNYVEVESALKSLGFTNIKYNVLYDIFWGFTKDGEVESVSIAGKTDYIRGDVFAADAEIIITYHMPEDDDPSNIKMEKGSDAYDGMNCLEAEMLFKNMGFTNVALGRVTTESTLYTDGEVFLVEIGGRSFKEGDVFSPDDKVYIKYYAVSKPSYSTNDYETAKKGNAGVFSYKSKGGSYDIYWIIDFDKGYVYTFTEGNGEDSCDKLKIVSGDLNNRITVTWNDGGTLYNWYLHFKYVNSPVTLVVNDHLGFTTEFSTTDLDDALITRETKKIVDRSDETGTVTEETTIEETTTGTVTDSDMSSSGNTSSESGTTRMVWIPASGSKYHSKSSCSNMKSPRQVSLEYAQQQGYEACKKCH